MSWVVSAFLILVGILHLYPVVGVAGTVRLEALYGVSVTDTDLLVLMRHRAVLFGLIGLLLIAAAFRPALQPVAIAAGLISMLTFVAIGLTSGETNAAIRRVVVADVVGSAALFVAIGLMFVGRNA